MKTALTAARRLLAAAAFALPVAVQATPVPLFLPFEGNGNLLVIDAASQSGGWTGSLDPSPFPHLPSPLSLVSVVLFQLDAATQTLSGSFEFTAAADLASILFGSVSGSYLSPTILLEGGQFSIDYSIQGGTGAYAGASGYGLSFVDFDPAGSFNNYAEAGTLVATVPEPGSLVLTLAGLALLAGRTAGSRRRDDRASL